MLHDGQAAAVMLCQLARLKKPNNISRCLKKKNTYIKACISLLMCWLAEALTGLFFPLRNCINVTKSERMNKKRPINKLRICGWLTS